MPTPEELEAAEVFLRKAASDLAAARLLAGDDAQDDDVVGFHAQQAVEKALKAVVAVRSLEIPRSHDIGVLIRMLDLAGGELPFEVRQADCSTRGRSRFATTTPGRRLTARWRWSLPRRCSGLGSVWPPAVRGEHAGREPREVGVS